MMFGMKKQVIAVEGRMCEHCASHVKEALLSLPDVKSVEVDLKGKKAVIKAKEELSEDVLKEAIEKAGYQFGGILE